MHKERESMKRRTSFSLIAGIVAAPFIGLPKSNARPKHFHRIWKPKRRYWRGNHTGFDGNIYDSNNWLNYELPIYGDTIVVDGGVIRLPRGYRIKRLEVHSGIVRIDEDSICEIEELVVKHNGELFNLGHTVMHPYNTIEVEGCE